MMHDQKKMNTIQQYLNYSMEISSYICLYVHVVHVGVFTKTSFILLTWCIFAAYPNTWDWATYKEQTVSLTHTVMEAGKSKIKVPASAEGHAVSFRAEGWRTKRGELLAHDSFSQDLGDPFRS
jgi:hypothetical protein